MRGTVLRGGAGVALALVVATTLISGCGSSHPFYVNFIRIAGVTYVHRPEYPFLPLSALDRQVATITTRLQDSVSDPNRAPRDGDAGFLAPNTPVYTMTGYRASFRLAVKQRPTVQAAEEVWYYDAEVVPGARTIGDWLDIHDKVVSIGIHRGPVVAATISDASHLRTLVPLLLDAPAGPAQPKGTGETLFLDFHLVDGSWTSVVFYPETGALTTTLRAPPAFTQAILAALPPTQPSPQP